MTEERQNEIWAMLTQLEKADIKRIYSIPCQENWNKGYNGALEFIFGKHNLTAQAEEKPKEPKYKVGDKVRIINKSFVNPDYVGIVDEIAEVKGRYKLKNTDSNWSDDSLEPYTEPKEEATTSDEKDACFGGIHLTSDGEMFISHDIYCQYRLDLTKEIAVAMVATDRIDIAKNSVAIANEIVKRLKETEI